MSNRKHNACTLRTEAAEAKKRLSKNEYAESDDGMRAPKGLTPSQKEVFSKLRELKSSGVEIVNPIKQLADERLMSELTHAERQRYILQLSADYVAMNRIFDDNTEKKQ